MVAIEEIFREASRRAQEKGLSYDGELLPREAYRIIQEVRDARLVDVRTRPELEFVGHVPGALTIEWKSYPGMRINERFAEELQAQVDPGALVMFVCRSGARSHETSVLAKQLGYRKVFNVLEGFEGNKDEHGHRNTVGGWRAAGLPWVQG